MRCFSTVLVLALGALPSTVAAEDAPRLEILPADIELSGARDRQGFVVLARRDDGSTDDVTSSATLALDHPLASVSPGFLAPRADGAALLTANWGGAAATASLRVTRTAEAAPLGFRNDVLPVLTRSGCNTGKCHGAAAGKDGFRLSLFGYDPEGDYFRITREAPGRRIDLKDPQTCLLLNKATGNVPHTGGQLFEEESEGYRLLLQWLENGAQRDAQDASRPIGLDVFPGEVVFSRAGGQQRLVVRAKYSDGTDRDVTRFAVFIGNNDSAAVVSGDGVVTAAGTGEAFVLARFDEFTEGASIIVRPGTPFAPLETQEPHYIDRHVRAKLDKLHLEPAEGCSDEVFLRRAFIDLVGALPTSADRRQFLADSRPTKRADLVDRLLEREEFGSLWAMKWTELLQVRANNGLSDKGLMLYEQWVRERARSCVTIDRILKELLAAQGSAFESPAVTYFQNETSPQLLAENVAQAFLGTRIQCAQCHNHPFDRWTMSDYYGFAAFFSRVGYKNGRDPRELIVFEMAAGGMSHPLTGKSVDPKFLGGSTADVAAEGDYRTVLAEWLVSVENERFAANFANIVWSHFFGRGVVDPVDDSRVSNPASNAPLLAALGRQAAAYGFEVKRLARDICTSRTYQQTTRAGRAGGSGARNFAQQSVRRMRAEGLLDCIDQVTETNSAFAGLPLGGRAVEAPGDQARNYFLTTFGRSSRSTPCSCEVKTGPTLSQALHLLNGETTNAKIADGRVVDKLLGSGASSEEVAAELFVRCLCREPTSNERVQIRARLHEEPDPQQTLEDLLWALLNSNEFVFNH